MNKPSRKTIADLKKVQGISEVTEVQEVTETTETTESTQTETTETTAETETEATETTQTTTTEASTSVMTTTATVEMVSISATELAQLRADSRELHLMKPQYAVLDKWYKNMNQAGATGGQDASEASPTKTRVSKATQRAIDMKNAK